MPENKYKELSKQLRKKPVSPWKDREESEVHGFSDGYKEYLWNSPTERKSINEAIRIAENAGFVDFDEFVKNPPDNPAGSKVYLRNRGKAVAFFKLGDDISKGINMVAAHVDSPRIDFKPSPLHEDISLAMAHTHYYGGVKKYQWFNIPLALDGVVITKEGKKVAISIGFDRDDPVFVISDLLPHLDRRKGDISEVFKADTLKLLLGSKAITYNEDEDGKVEDPVLLNILNLLNDRYGITEADLFSAEIEIVPATEPRDVGLDRSLIGGYGHDDRVCSYTALRAILDMDSQNKTACTLLIDKEEIGSMGNTGARYHFWKKAVSVLIKLYGQDTMIEDVMERSTLLSADVSAALNPSFKEVHEAQNAPKIGMGISILKYTGARGKGGSNDAHAEVLGSLRKLFDEKKIHWQSGLLGKVDQGGGGTVALFFAEQGISVVDAGVPVLGMHSPYEIVSKADVYETYMCYKVFFESFEDVMK